MTDDVIVLGASGHAKVVIELLRANGRRVAFCVSAVAGPESCLGVPVLLGDEHLPRLRQSGYESAIIAIGSNVLRERARDAVSAAGFKLVNAVSPHAMISPSARIGAGVAIMAGVAINADCEIGDLAIINTGATVDHDCDIGVASHVGPQCAIAGNVKVGPAAFLGIGATVIPGVRIGAGATVGAGAVILSDVAAGSTVVGVPARPLSSLNSVRDR